MCSLAEIRERLLDPKVDLLRRPELFALQSPNTPVSPTELVDNILAAYRGNGSIFSLELSAAVHRQMVFVEKMYRLKWLDGPGSKDVIQFFCQRFRNFFLLFRSANGRTLVPTVDMDLAWHTLQLSPARYYDACLFVTGDSWIGHDDTITQGRIQAGFDTTDQIYYQACGQSYFQCFCWFCMAVLSVTKRNLKSGSFASDPTSLLDEARALLKELGHEQLACNSQVQRLAVVSQN